MITVFIAENLDKAKAIIEEMLSKPGNININITRHGNTVRMMNSDDIKGFVSLKDKIIELENSLHDEKKGVVYRCCLEVMERHLIEHILERTDGNQFKAARILGINRNTMRAKVKKLGINPQAWKI